MFLYDNILEKIGVEGMRVKRMNGLLEKTTGDCRVCSQHFSRHRREKPAKTHQENENEVERRAKSKSLS